MLKAKPDAIPADHSSCRGRASCLQCEAQDNLEPSDWLVHEFYLFVADQVENLAPMGTEDGKGWIVPRLEGWLAACRIWGVPRNERAWLIEMALYVHRCLHGRLSVADLYLEDPENWRDG